MDTKRNFDNGIYVVNVDKNGPCGNGRLKEGDIITEIDGVKINNIKYRRWRE